MNAGTDPNYGQQRQQTDCEVVLAGSGRFQAAFLRENSSQHIIHRFLLLPQSKLRIIFSTLGIITLLSKNSKSTYTLKEMINFEGRYPLYWYCTESRLISRLPWLICYKF
jgi:hypothetical protein